MESAKNCKNILKFVIFYMDTKGVCKNTTTLKYVVFSLKKMLYFIDIYLSLKWAWKFQSTTVYKSWFVI